MNKIEQYIDSIFGEVNQKSQQIIDLKEEIRIHLLESIKELQLEGKTEEEAIEIAIKRFGEPTVLTKSLLGKLEKRVHVAKWLLRASLFFLIAGLAVGIIGFVLLQKYNNTETQLNQMLASYDGKPELTEQDKMEMRYELENNPALLKVNYVEVMNRRDIGAMNLRDGIWIPVYGEEEIENSRLFILVNNILGRIQYLFTPAHDRPQFARIEPDPGYKFKGTYVYIIITSKDWQIKYQYKGFALLIYYYLIIPLILIGTAILLFGTGRILSFANGIKLFRN